MITGVLDVGSNSVRLMLSEDGKTLSKRSSRGWRKGFRQTGD